MSTHGSVSRATIKKSCELCRSEFVAQLAEHKRGRARFCCRSCASKCSPKFNVKHGLYTAPEYRIWTSMRGRTNCQEHADYKNYGARGIKVCERWDSFAAFLADMGHRPSLDHSIDRIDNDGNYEPSNCRWATRAQQSANRRVAARFKFGDREMTAAEIFALSPKCVVSKKILYLRLSRNWSLERAISQPSRSYP